jgi:hypothetical protein
VARLRHAVGHGERLLIGVDQKQPADSQNDATDPNQTSFPPLSSYFARLGRASTHYRRKVIQNSAVRLALICHLALIPVLG